MVEKEILDKNYTCSIKAIILVQIILIKNKLEFGNSKEGCTECFEKKRLFICQRIGNEIEVISNGSSK